MQPVWFKLHSKRIAPYTVDDISVIIPSAAGRYEERWKWFAPQYMLHVHPTVMQNTYIPCDPEEVEFLRSLFTGDIKPHILPTGPRFIVPKTLKALQYINTRLTFRLANDIMVARSGWENVLLKQFNASKRPQIISEIQHGISTRHNWEKLSKAWPFFKEKYPEPPVSAVYCHGSRIFSQTATWDAYYRKVIQLTSHDHDDVLFSQLAQYDGIDFTHFGGINAYLPHKGTTNKDFDESYISEIEGDRKRHANLPDNPGFRPVG